MFNADEKISQDFQKIVMDDENNNSDKSIVDSL